MILKPIHLYFDKIKNGHAVGNGLFPEFNHTDHKSDSNVAILPSIQFEMTSTKLGHKVLSIDSLDAYVEQNCHNLYIIEPRNLKLFVGNNIFEYISDIAKKYIRNNKLCLVIYYPFEAFPVDQSLFKCELLVPIVSSAKMENFPLDNISLIYGDLNVAKNYNKSSRLPQEQEFNRIFPLSYWEIHHQNHIKHSSLESVPAEKWVSCKKRTHKFLCFNGAARRHRFVTVSEMIRRNIIDCGLVSILGRYGTDKMMSSNHKNKLFFDKNNPDEIEMFNHFINYLDTWQPRYLDINVEEINIDDRQFDKNLYLETFFSVVTETEMTENVLFITEKTFKPIVNLHPFLMIGSAGTLAYLRKEGYETFPELFDESYDDEPDEKKRLLMVMDELERVSQCPLSVLRKIYHRVWPKLVHNRNHFMTRDHTSKYEKMFEHIFGDNK